MIDFHLLWTEGGTFMTLTLTLALDSAVKDAVLGLVFLGLFLSVIIAIVIRTNPGIKPYDASYTKEQERRFADEFRLSIDEMKLFRFDGNAFRHRGFTSGQRVSPL